MKAIFFAFLTLVCLSASADDQAHDPRFIEIRCEKKSSWLPLQQPYLAAFDTTSPNAPLIHTRKFGNLGEGDYNCPEKIRQMKLQLDEAVQEEKWVEITSDVQILLVMPPPQAFAPPPYQGSI